MLKADHMRSLPEFFTDVDDPRCRQGLRHPLPSVLAIAAAATLCGRRGYRDIAEWASGLSQRARERLRCRRRRGRYEVPSAFVIRDVLTRVDPAQFNRALKRWHAVYDIDDETLAIAIKALQKNAGSAPPHPAAGTSLPGLRGAAIAPPPSHAREKR